MCAGDWFKGEDGNDCWAFELDSFVMCVDTKLGVGLLDLLGGGARFLRVSRGDTDLRESIYVICEGERERDRLMAFMGAPRYSLTFEFKENPFKLLSGSCGADLNRKNLKKLPQPVFLPMLPVVKYLGSL